MITIGDGLQIGALRRAALRLPGLAAACQNFNASKEIGNRAPLRRVALCRPVKVFDIAGHLQNHPAKEPQYHAVNSTKPITQRSMPIPGRKAAFRVSTLCLASAGAAKRELGLSWAEGERSEGWVMAAPLGLAHTTCTSWAELTMYSQRVQTKY